jgi:aspartate kinase
VSAPVVVKFGGDALALPERIALAARRVGERLERSPVVAVASARRGVTDHLLGLVEQVKEETASAGVETSGLAAASDRAVAAGELVAASLLAVALNRLGIRAEVLDAREAGLQSDGEWSRARLTGVRPARISRLLQRGITPVIAGFQGWHRGQITTLGRGGSDTTAVALAAELGAAACELVKHTGGLFTADPKVVPDARHIPRASHHFLSRLAAAGAKVMSFRAAQLAEEKQVPLRFSSLDGEASGSAVSAGAADEAMAIAWRTGRYRFTASTPVRIEAERRSAFIGAVAAAGIPAELEMGEDGGGSHLDLLVDPGDHEACLTLIRPLLPRGRRLALLATGLSSVTVVGQPLSPELREYVAHSSGTHLLRTSPGSNAVSFLVPDHAAIALVHTLHTTLFRSEAHTSEPFFPTQPHLADSRRAYVG